MDLTITDQKGAVAAQTADWIMPDQNPGRRWTTARAVSGLVTVRYRMKVTPFEQGGPPFGVKAAGYGLGGNTGSLLMLPELPGLRQTTVRWDLSEMVKGSRGVMAGGLGTITIQGPSDSLLDRWLLAGPLTAGQSAYGHDFNAYNVDRLKHLLRANGFNLGATESHIIPLLIGDAHLCKETSALLLDRHAIYVQPINYPTVAVGQERLRITPTPAHSERDMQALVAALIDARTALGWGAPLLRDAA